MNPLAQNILVLSLVAFCVLVVARQAFRSLNGKPSKLGSCCAKGCQPPTPTSPKSERIVFLPVEMLGRRK
jgi:hypothetical protein